MKRLSGNKILSLFLTLVIVISALVILSVSAIEPNNGDEYKSYVGSVAMFNTYSEYDVLLCDHPDNFNWDINKAILNANIPSDLKLVITDCFINTKEQLFYKVEAAPGHTLPEILNKYSWVYQNDLGISEEYDALVILPDISAVPENGDENSTVTVSGKFPSDTVLSATEYTDSSEIEEILIEADADEVLTPEYDENGNVIKKSFLMDSPYRFLDLSLMREGVEIKADGTVIVTMDAASLGLYEGDAFLVYHIHQNEDGSYEKEQLGPFKVKNGKASFEMNSFSYVLVVSSTEIVSLKDAQGKYYDMHNFYPVQTYSDNLTLPLAGNGNLCLLGIYYDDLGGHILVGIPKGGNIKSDFLNYVYIDGKEYDATTFGTAGGTVSGESVQYLVSSNKMNITQLSAMDTVTNSTKVLMDISKTTSQKLLGYIDIIVGHEIELKDGFTLSLDTKTGGNSGGNAFDIGKTLFDLDVDYAIDKTVHSIGGNTSMSGDVVTANGIIGSQNVVYEIKVTNTS